MRNLTYTLAILFTYLTGNSQGNSPYSQYGLGNINPSSFQSNFAMGGLGSTYSSKYYINPLNPAGYSEMKYAIGEVGVLNSNNFYSDGNTSGTESTFNLGHFGFGFPISSFAGAAVGIMPYSKMKYDYSFEDFNSDNTPIIRKFRGIGNVNQLFLGTGFKIKQLSVGVNAKYLFGELTQAELLEFLTSDFTNIRKQDFTLIRGWNFNTSANYDFNIGEEHLLTVGSNFEFGKNLNTYEYQIINNYSAQEVTEDGENILIENHSGGTILNTTENDKKKSSVFLPQKYQAGIGFSKKNKYYVGLDYKNEAWNTFQFQGTNQGLTRSQKIILGGELLPNSEAKGVENYWKSVTYRAGLSYGSSSIIQNGQQLLEYGIKFGLGFPLGKYKYESEKFGSYLFTSFGYDRVNGGGNGNITENYLKVNFTVILNDKWFVQRKFD